MEKRFINRYKSFCDSLSSLKKAKERDPADDFVLSGTAQKFNLTFDLSWKVMKDIIVKYHKIQDFATESPRETLRKAYSVGLISDDCWMDMLSIRNNLDHDYDGSLVRESFYKIVEEYVPLLQAFQEKAEPYMKWMEEES
ncbi:MAG: nucleotidyltransferase substrate binding protein [Lachnospiraceae bacterium]|nr:nucleotidyltransferase substrate binding protein [Lachnospiraceae bacterium]